MNILSLFDGMSCGQLALKRIGIIPDNYFASEIKTDGISVTMSNFPNTKQVGDVTKLDGKSLGKIDLLIGGSPCQDLSIAMYNRTGLAGIKSKLFYEYVRLLKETNPTYFLLENVGLMSEADKAVITEIMGVEPIAINSLLISAQLRNRLYWTNLK
ncbi:MAG: DNA cytosine methyltransferase, partial [Candidatus Omnitrophica bacterium]|nr:DNA cytosine methyltransferase [Candidatus Omnitrophota bacterium]